MRNQSHSLGKEQSIAPKALFVHWWGLLVREDEQGALREAGVTA